MPKRTFWLATGVAVGAGSTLWAERKVRRTWQEAAARLQPDAIVVEVGRSARQVAVGAGDRVRDAVSSGREEMQRREEELWAELAAQGTGPEPPPHLPSDRPSTDRQSDTRQSGVRPALTGRSDAGPADSGPGDSGRSRSGRSRLARLGRPLAKSLSYLGN
ncbi:MAG: hypothetical protein ABSF33_15155 [Acidimicrobiales bacterium]|jgi:hypothetical protein